MKPSNLFLETLTELRRRLAAINDEYELVMASGLLRKLLLDGEPLVHQLNRGLRLQLRFPIATTDAFDAALMRYHPVFDLSPEGLSPKFNLLPSAVTKQVDLDTFLAQRAAAIQGREVSVKDLIRQVSHIEGGVHAGTARTEIERLLAAASESVRINGVTMTAATIRGIGLVVLDGLAPLEAAVTEGPL